MGARHRFIEALVEMANEGEPKRCGCGSVAGAHYCPNVNPPSRIPAHDLTPSDVTLSKMLAAYDAWSGGEDNQSADILGELSEVMVERGLLDIERALTIDGAALLDRARKAGVL